MYMCECEWVSECQLVSMYVLSVCEFVNVCVSVCVRMCDYVSVSVSECQCMSVCECL